MLQIHKHTSLLCILFFLQCIVFSPAGTISRLRLQRIHPAYALDVVNRPGLRPCRTHMLSEFTHRSDKGRKSLLSVTLREVGARVKDTGGSDFLDICTSNQAE